MASRLIMISRFPTTPEHKDALCEKLSQSSQGRILKSLSSPEVIEILPLPEGSSLLDLVNMAPPVGDTEIGKMMVADVRREVLDFVEAPKDCSDPIPQTRFIQLRHVEVMPSMMSAYRKWREETIFDVVRGNDAAEIFLAYHSVISGVPGVMFVAGFDAPVETYNADFTSERYKDIVQQAGDTYITGGTDGLYTEFYESASAARSAAHAA